MLKHDVVENAFVLYFIYQYMQLLSQNIKNKEAFAKKDNLALRPIGLILRKEINTNCLWDRTQASTPINLPAPLVVAN